MQSIDNNISDTEHYYRAISKLKCLKSALSDLRQFLETESPLKMMKNTFYFTLFRSFCSQDI